MTKTENQRLNTEKITRLLFFLVIIAVYFFALGGFPLVGPDEPRYSQVAREMFEHSDFVTPTLGGANWFEKPVLLYWLQIFFYNIFGVSEFSARFGSALFGLGTIASLWILGNFVTQRNLESGIRNLESGKTDFANWLALIAASSVGLMAFSRGASFDIILTFPITASLVAFFIFDQTQNPPANAGGSDRSASPRPRISASLFAFYFFVGIALLAKGLIGIVLPFAIVGFYHFLSRKLPGRTFIFSLFWGTLFSFLVASLWYLPMYLRHGWEFIDEFFIQHHFQRYTSNKYQHPQPFWFFWLVLPLMTIPWLPFFPALIWNLLKRRGEKEKRRRGDAETRRRGDFFSSSPLLLFSLSWLLVPLIFFSFSGSKLPGYILPALPAALIFTAIYVHQFVRKSANRKLAVQFLAFSTFAVVVFLLRFVVPDFAADDSTKYLISAASARGYTTEKVLNLHTISHNSEFYAAGRLIREPSGKLRKFLSAAEVLEEIKKESRPVLVLVPHEYLHELTESDLVTAEVLNKNAEHAIVFVRAKN
ncbi:MAG TPA: glycosyltransferase family 39 protein [Pyrinomonadaceae bacterium]|nr:glycosyltransferase family 39 protein [Pyrinomonadaceae bacterium]